MRTNRPGRFSLTEAARLRTASDAMQGTELQIKRAATDLLTPPNVSPPVRPLSSLIQRSQAGLHSLIQQSAVPESLTFQRVQARPLRDRTASFIQQSAVRREPHISARPSSPAARQNSQTHSAVSCAQRASHFSAPKLARRETEQPASFSSQL
jgi:hypothetical protein